MGRGSLGEGKGSSQKRNLRATSRNKNSTINSLKSFYSVALRSETFRTKKLGIFFLIMEIWLPLERDFWNYLATNFKLGDDKISRMFSQNFRFVYPSLSCLSSNFGRILIVIENNLKMEIEDDLNASKFISIFFMKFATLIPPLWCKYDTNLCTFIVQGDQKVLQTKIMKFY